jgi:hypothetical protein
MNISNISPDPETIRGQFDAGQAAPIPMIWVGQRNSAAGLPQTVLADGSRGGSCIVLARSVMLLQKDL